MHEEQTTDSHLESSSLDSSAATAVALPTDDNLGEQFKGQILNRNNITILNDTNSDLNEDEFDSLIKQNDLELILNNEIISPVLFIYNGQTADRNNLYQLFTLRNLNDLDELNLSKLAILRNCLEDENEVNSNNSKFSSINDRLCDKQEQALLDINLDEQIKSNLSRFWSEINLDLCDDLDDSNAISSLDDDSPVLMCLICKLKFTSSNQLAKHTDQKHNDALLSNAERYLLLKQRPQSAILQLSNSNQNRPILTFLSSNLNDNLNSLNSLNMNSKLNSQSADRLNMDVDEENDEEDQNSQNNLNLQVTTNNFLNSLLGGDQKESQQTKDQKDDLETNAFNDLNDLVNLENIAKVAAAALQKSNNQDSSDQSIINSLNASAQLNSANNSIFDNQTANSILSSLNSLTGNNSNNSAVANLVNLLPQLTVQQQQQLQLLASVNQSGLLNSNNLQLLNSTTSQLTSTVNNTTQSSTSSTSNQQQPNQATQSLSSTAAQQPINVAAVAAGLGQHHMAMLHSRNSCKTLKCPKCNWHYKYQETLEIHMKEKHPETELNCVYCLTNQQHPRLARGETYTCGYKPYRCNFCNYSTTTKGNLSIHMQSDKHINNVQEISNGNLPPEVLQNLVQQQQQLSQQANSTGTGVSAAADQTTTQTTSTNNLLSPNSTLTNTTASLLNTSTNNTDNLSNLNNLTNLNSSSNNQQLTNASGNQTQAIQTANSSPSNSSSLNLQQSQQQQPQPQLTPNQSSSSNGQSTSQSNSTGGSKGTIWRCDVCKYDTSLARNLRIHMTSEKHTNNMLLLQQNVRQMQQLNTLQGTNQSAATATNNLNSLDSSAQAMLQQLNPSLLAALCSASNNQTSNNGSNPLDNSAELDLAFNQALMMSNQLNQQHQNSLNNSNNQTTPNPQQQSRQLPNELLMLLPSDRQAIVDLEHPDPSLKMDYTDYDEHHCRIFQCMVCAVFTCDSVEQLAAHLQIDRTKIREDEVLGQISGGNDKSIISFCKLCPYKTQLKANFQLHCKTDKHLQRLQQVNHIKEGGLNNEWKLKYVNVSNPIQLRCNLCDYYTNSLHKLQLHVTNTRHEASTRVFLHLKLNDQLIRANDSEIRQTVYRCEPCSLSHSTIFGLLHHLNSARHIQSENFRQIKLQMAMSSGNMTMKTLDEEIRELFTVKKDEEDLESDNQNSSDLQQPNRLQQSNSSSSNLSHLLCPLCQSKFNLRANLEQHIIDTHKVSKEGVERLMIIVDSVKENNHTNINNSTSTNQPLSPSNKLTNHQLNNSLNSNHSCIDDLLNENSLEYSDDFNEPLRSSSTANQQTTDRHLHKFRCTQCPLSFKTSDKLAIHSQYHKIRAASQCVLCGKTTRSIESMQKHMEICHKEMNEQELDIYRLSLINNPLLLSLKNGCQGVLDPSTTELLKRESNREFNENGSLEDNEMDEEEDQQQQKSPFDEQMDDDEQLNKDEELNDEQQLLNQSNNLDDKLLNNNSLQPNEEYLNSQNVAEDGYNDPNRKYKCHRCRVAYTRQSYLSAHNKTLYHRKGEKLTYPMEKYLDPNRPFKCEMCKESFTQKNILMTHYNSVSHLHRLNQAKKEMNSSNSQLIGSQSSNNDLLNNDSNDELFKCNICKVSFNNGLSLDNHIQSAQHQNRASKLAQLAISGQIDLNKPLVERPSNNLNKMDDESNSNNMNLLNEQLFLLQQLQSQQQPQSNNSNGENGVQLTCSQCSMVFNNQNSLNQHQQICLLLSSLNSKESANQPNNLNIDLIQSQLNNSNNKFLTLPVSKNKPPVYKHLLETWGYEIVQQFNEHHQRRKKQNNNEDDKMDSTNNDENDDEMNDEDDEDEEGKMHLIIRLKEPREENMEDILAKGWNEDAAEGNNDEPKINNADSNQEDEEGTDKEKIKLILDQEDDQEDKKENDPNTTNNSDQNKFKCETCLKEFSSIWILKAHKEEVHNDVVKMEKVQDFAEIYRKEFLERKNNIVVKSVVLDSENNNHVQRTQSSTPITSTVTTQSSNNVNSNSTGSAVDQQSNNNNENNDSLNDSKANASQSTNELNNSTNSINANNSNNNSNNDLANSLLAGNPLANPLLASNPLLANNPLLSQAVASMMQQQQNSNNSTNNNANDVANQMAQLQVNQLLMSLSLAGAMNNNAANNSPNQQQQAAMMALLQQGLPPQMLPILMANAQANSTPDPMMSLFASNPMLAAAAAASNAVNPLTSLFGGMSPEAMVAAGFLPGMINNLQQQSNQSASKSPSLNTASTSNPLTASPSTSLLNSTVGSCQAAQNAQSGKRARTRISDDQLKILRQYFDINNSPTEEALQEMAAKSQLPLKVIKHWFRNTLFKERQRNKDSPYNFNNPPSTYLNLEEYEKTGETKVSMIDEKPNEHNKEENSSSAITPVPSMSGKTTPALNQESAQMNIQNIKNENETNTMKSDSFNSQSEDDEKVSVKQENQQSQQQQQQNVVDNIQQFLAAMAAQSQQQLLQNQINGLTANLNQSHMNENNNQSTHNESMKSFNTTNGPNSEEDSMDSINTNDTSSQPNMQIYSGLQFAGLPGMPPISNSLQLALNSQLGGNSSAAMGLLSGSCSNSATSTPSCTPTTSNSANNPGKRANRTRFNDYQIRVLQEFFESNAYPKDDDLEYLSRVLTLSPRVIVVWFQNARQKARKVYENQPPSINDLHTPATPNSGLPPAASTTPTGGNLNLTPCTTPNSATSSNSATPNPLGKSANNSSAQQNTQRLNYDCQKCSQSFQRYYELIKHMKSSCFKDENPVAVNVKNLQNNKQNDDSFNNNNNSLNSDFNMSSNQATAMVSNGTFQCDKCSMSFNRLDLFQKHQVEHIMNPNLLANLQQNNGSAFGNLNLNQFECLLSAQQRMNQPSSSPSLGKSPNNNTSNLFGNSLNDQDSSSPTQQQQALLLQQQILEQLQRQQPNQLNKRKFSNDDDDDCDSQSGGDGSQCSGNGGSRSAVSSRDKRLRTTILPEQLDFLYQKYQLESNPSRKMLESISEEVGLKKRVVQVWFQNARARSRKNQLKPIPQMINKRCPFCRALYKTRAALESHLATRHADQYTKGEIDIDNLPDSDSAEESSMPNSSNLNNAFNAFNLSNLDNGDNNGSTNGLNALNLFANNNLLANNLLNSGNDLSQLLQQNNGGDNADMANQLRQLLSNIMSNGNNEQTNDQDDQDEDLNDGQQLNNSINNNSINNNESTGPKKKGEFALDLSKPLDLS